MDVWVEGKIKLVDRDGGRTLSWIEYEVYMGGTGSTQSSHDKQAEENGDTVIHLIATFTARGEEGKGYASMVVEKGLRFAEKFWKVKVSCPYIKRWIEKRGYSGNVEYTNLLKFKESIEKFNRYHSPEAVAEYVRHERDRVYVKFYGPFCRSCGVYDYFEDILMDLEGIDAKIESYEELDGDDGFLVVYRITDGVLY